MDCFFVVEWEINSTHINFKKKKKTPFERDQTELIAI
jgi:hypothetical protein